MHFGIDGLEPVAGGVQLGPADVGRAVQHLALEVAEIDDVEIDEADPADAGRGEVQPERRAEPAGADQQDAGRLQPLLPLHADFGHDQVPAVRATSCAESVVFVAWDAGRSSTAIGCSTRGTRRLVPRLEIHGLSMSSPQASLRACGLEGVTLLVETARHPPAACSLRHVEHGPQLPRQRDRRREVDCDCRPCMRQTLKVLLAPCF